MHHIRHEQFMAEAMQEAERAAQMGEVPIGALVVDANGQIISRAHNLRETTQDATAHAEILAIREANRKLGSWRLIGCTLYVTLEPCPMCAGALVQSRIEHLVYGASDPKAWADRNLLEIVQNPGLNHRMQVTGGVLAEQSAAILKQFFRQKRGCSAAADAL